MAHILIVDDAPEGRHTLSFILKREGHTITTAASGGEALEQLASSQIDLVIADLNMPEMSGLVLTEQIHACSHLHHVRVLILTASSKVQDRLAAQEAGADSFLTKPASSRDLIATVDRLLGGSCEIPGSYAPLS